MEKLGIILMRKIQKDYSIIDETNKFSFTKLLKRLLKNVISEERNGMCLTIQEFCIFINILDSR